MSDDIARARDARALTELSTATRALVDVATRYRIGFCEVLAGLAAGLTQEQGGNDVKPQTSVGMLAVAAGISGLVFNVPREAILNAINRAYDDAEAPCCAACGFRSKTPPRSSAYAREHRDHHLRAFPNADGPTRQALELLVAMAERDEARTS